MNDAHAIIVAGGGEYIGTWPVEKGNRIGGWLVFNDPLTASTLVADPNGLTAEKVRDAIRAHRLKYLRPESRLPGGGRMTPEMAGAV